MIYCVEDDASIRDLVIYTLQSTGFEATGFSCGEDFFKALEESKPDLVILDVMLPGEDGISILKKLKDSYKTEKIPVIMATAKSAEYEKVKGLDTGADDYITKPFGMMELVSRVKAVLRRTAPEGQEKKIIVENVTLDIEQHKVFADNQEISLTFKEFELLHCLMERPGHVFTRDQLLEKIWGYEFDGETRTVDVHVRSLRQKLGEGVTIIETVRGVGYRVVR